MLVVKIYVRSGIIRNYRTFVLLLENVEHIYSKKQESLCWLVCGYMV